MRIFLTGGLIVALASGATAGPLDPPGAPSDTPGPEPRIAINATNTPGSAEATFLITQPGSYYLTGNVTGESGKSGIVIAANDVEIDLQGFTLRGVAGSLDGILVPFRNPRFQNVAVRHGTVRDWGNDGVNLERIFDSARVEYLRALDNAQDGIILGTNAVVTGCSAEGNGANGIATSEGSSMSNCTAARNFDGLTSGRGSALSDCAAYLNAGSGIGIIEGGSAANCAARDNGGVGFVVQGGSTLTGCSAAGNGSHGILTVGTGALINACNASFNFGDGILTGGGARIVDSEFAFNGRSGMGVGIHVTGGDVVIGNTVTSNRNAGIWAQNTGSLIMGNTATANAGGSFDLGANMAGPVIDATTILGNSNPAANYSH